MTAWSEVALQDVAVLERDAVAPDEIEDGTTYVGLEHIGTGGEFVNVGVVEGGDLKSTKFAFSPAHVLYGKLRPYLGKIALPDFAGVCTTEIIPIRPGTKLDRNFLAHFLRQPEQIELATARSTGANLPRLSPTELANFKIPIPPLAEQHRMAAILDQADALRAKRRAALAQLDPMAQAIFTEMFGDPISNSMQWPVVELGSIAKIERGKFTPRPRNDPSYYNGNFPFIQTGDISNSGGRLKMWNQSLNDKGRQVSRSFPVGTVVIAIVGATLGVTAILEIEAYCPDSVIGLQVNANKGTPEYVEHLLRIWRPIFVSQAPDTARANMNLETLRPLEVPAPPIQLQRSFSARVRAIENIKATSMRQLVDLHSIFASLQHRAFNGEL